MTYNSPWPLWIAVRTILIIETLGLTAFVILAQFIDVLATQHVILCLIVIMFFIACYFCYKAIKDESDAEQVFAPLHQRNGNESQ